MSGAPTSGHRPGVRTEGGRISMFGGLARALGTSLLLVGITVGVGQPAAAWFPPQADLSITKTDWPDPVAPGTNLTYRIRVANAGPDPAAAVTMTDVIPV